MGGTVGSPQKLIRAEPYNWGDSKGCISAQFHKRLSTMSTPTGTVTGFNLFVRLHRFVSLEEASRQWELLSDAEKMELSEKATHLRSRAVTRKGACGWNLFVGVQTEGKSGVDRVPLPKVSQMWKQLSPQEKKRWNALAF